MKKVDIDNRMSWADEKNKHVIVMIETFRNSFVTIPVHF